MSMTILIDCGTTNLRVTLVGEDGGVLAQSKRPGGVRHTAIDGHNGRLKQMIAESVTEALGKAGQPLNGSTVSRCVAYGMITSNVGLLEIPHLVAPVSSRALHEGMKTAQFPEVAPFPISFIPGVRNFGGAVTAENFSGMDMMRGEETEAVGLFELLRPARECVLILPGSHNKFVRMDAQGRILGCMTSISGEMLDAVTYHTILADAVERDFATAEDYEAEMACRGALECAANGIGRAAFAGRILSQLGGVESVRLRSYLLGVTLAQDIAALRAFVPDADAVQIYVAGKMPLQRAFADVAKVLGIASIEEIPPELSGQMGIRGALKIAQG